MNGRGRRRGVSFGTVLMLLITAAVGGAMLVLLAHLMGSTTLQLSPGRVQEAVTLGDGRPVLVMGTPRAAASPTPARLNIQQGLPAAAQTAAPQRSFTLTAGGTVSVETNIRQSGYYQDAKAYDFSEILSLLRDDFDSDLNLVTMENLIVPGAKVSELIVPDTAMRMLSAAGIDTVALGFPRAYDKGFDGLGTTVARAEDAGLRVIGAYTNAEQAAGNARVVTLDGVRVALLHYTGTLSNAGRSGLKRDGRAWALPLTDRAENDIRDARTAGAQVIVVSVNWGTAGRAAPTKEQKALAQKLADAGADVILGAGSRVVQAPEWLAGRDADGNAKRTLCIYSLGSLINDNRKDAQVAGMLLKLRIAVDEHGVVHFEQTAFIPTYVWRYKQDSMYYYRVVPCDMPAPDGMESAQQTSMQRARKTVETALKGILSEYPR